MARDNKEEIKEDISNEIINETTEEISNDISNEIINEIKGGIVKKKKVAKGNVVSNREYRMRKNDIINMRRRENRIKNKAVITPKPLYECEKILKGVDKLPEHKVKKGEKKEGKKEVTKKTYISFIRQFYKRNTGEELGEEDDIIKSIREERYNAQRVSKQFKGILNDKFDEIRKRPYEVNNLFKIFNGIRGFTEINKRLYAYVLEYGKQYEEKRSIAIVEEKEDLEISFEEEEIMKNIEKIVNRTDKIIYGFIFLIKGRLNDLRMLRIARDKEETMNIEYNYIYDNKIYINNTKNGKGRVIEMPDGFMRLCEGIKEGYLLGSLMPQSTLSQRLQRITMEIYGKVYTYLNIRHINATQINARGASLKEREETSMKAGHSVEQQLRYVYKVE
jgi:hypothetical protein